MSLLISAAYFPPVSLMAALAACGEAEVEAWESYPKQTYRNRALIMTAQGVRPLSVPVLWRNHMPMAEVAVDYRMRWPVVHLRTLEAAYAASPFYLFYKDELADLLSVRYDRLIDLDMATMRWLLSKMKIDCRLSATADYRPADGSPADLRVAFSPKRPLPPERFPSYCQVFCDRQPFAPDLSALDLLMNLGPEAADYLKTIS